jgi:eukaryotic-like serine/threonine-protein kinase
LGCTMYAMLAGAPPFQGTVAEVIHQHLHQAPAPLRMYRGDIPVPLEDLVMRLLAKDPDHRPSIADAKAVLAGLADSPTPTSPDGERRAASATRRWRFAAASAVAIVVPATVGLWILRGPDQPAAATTPLGTPSLTTAAIAPPPSSTSEPQASSSAGTPPKQASQASSSTPAQSGTQVPPSDPIAALRLAVQQQVSTGNLNPDKASDLYAKVDAIAHSAYTGNATDEAKNIKAFQDRLTALRTGGQLSASGYDVLSAAADAVSATLP